MTEPSITPEFISGRAAWIAGATGVAPFLIGTIPFGLITGIATKAAGLSAEAAAAMTVIVFAGTAQISALPLMAAGAPVLVIVLTAFIVNLRFLIYSATVAPYFKHLPLRWKFLLGHGSMAQPAQRRDNLCTTVTAAAASD